MYEVGLRTDIDALKGFCQESIKKGSEQQIREYQRFQDGYEDAPEKKSTQEQLKLLGIINGFEDKYYGK